MNNRPLILITNDDGYRAGGLLALIEAARPYGDLLVVAPAEGQSGMSHALTVKVPLRIEKYSEETGFTLYVCNGTPCDCVKFALNKFVGSRHPDLLLTGINHGANSSASVLYSGTMAAAIEGCMYHIPAIGFSMLDHSRTADFLPYIGHIKSIIENVMKNGLDRGVCLNVNIPKIPSEKIRGIKVCRQAYGYWIEEFVRNVDPNGQEYYWLTGDFFNEEPDAQDTDEWVLKQNYISVVPVQIDMTCYKSMNKLKKMFETSVSSK
jgi:5'-nucleotidase